MVDHDIGKNMRCVEGFNPKGPDDTIATSPASIPVLIAQNKADSILEDTLGGRCIEKRSSRNQSQQAFCCAVSNRPPVSPLTEGPTPFSREAVVSPGVGKLVDHLIFH